MPFKDQEQIKLKCIEGVVTNVILSKYEDKPLNNKVIANNSKLRAHYTVLTSSGSITPSSIIRS